MSATSMDDEFFKDPTVRRWVEHVVNDMKPKMEQSALVAHLVPTDEGEVKFWVELGASIMMEKPVVAIVVGDQKIPPKLEQIADEIVRLEDGVNPEGASELSAAIKRVLGEDEDADH